VSVEHARRQRGLHVDDGHRVRHAVVKVLRDPQPLLRYPTPCFVVTRRFEVRRSIPQRCQLEAMAADRVAKEHRCSRPPHEDEMDETRPGASKFPDKHEGARRHPRNHQRRPTVAADGDGVHGHEEAHEYRPTRVATAQIHRQGRGHHRGDANGSCATAHQCGAGKDHDRVPKGVQRTIVTGRLDDGRDQDDRRRRQGGEPEIRHQAAHAQTCLAEHSSQSRDRQRGWHPRLTVRSRSTPCVRRASPLRAVEEYLETVQLRSRQFSGTSYARLRALLGSAVTLGPWLPPGIAR
jgi:hypothetical protein